MERAEVSVDLNQPPSKRRKFYRKRETLEDETVDDNSISTPSATPIASEALTIEELISHHANQSNLSSQHEESTQLTAADILRQRKTARRRRLGIEFTNADNARPSTATPGTSNTLTEKDDITPEIKTVVDRFAPQTGQVADVDKHMWAPLLMILFDHQTGARH